MSDWNYVDAKTPEHMQEVAVWIDDPEFGSGERARTVVFLGFDHNFYDAEEQTLVHYVTKWRKVCL